MIDISFVNASYLFILIPLLAAVIIPFCIVTRKDNRSVSSVTSLILHVVMVGLIALSAAGTTLTKIMTETQVYVVADVSYSANKNLGTVDEYIREVEDSMPGNSKMGVVCFASDYVLHTALGEDFESVSSATAKVDVSSTNIQDALNYTATLFDNNVIKKIVLITDGKETDPNGLGGLISSVEKLNAQNIYIDAMYLDDNIKESTKEVQISQVNYTKSTYLNHETTADVLVESNYDTDVFVTLVTKEPQQGEVVSLASDLDMVIEEKAVSLAKGLNVVDFVLPTEKEGTFSYEVSVRAQEDENSINNAYGFTQEVSGKVSILLISGDNPKSINSTYNQVKELYGNSANITPFEVPKERVPFTVESLCKYDEIVISDVDITCIENYAMFVDSLNTVVSQFGKSLVTFGDLQLQNKMGADNAEEEQTPDAAVELFKGMLPIEFGNDNQDGKLLTIVLDTSRSMEQASKYAKAKEVSIGLLEMLTEQDRFAIVTFWGDNNVLQQPVKATKENIEKAIKEVEDVQAKQGTLIGEALNAAFKLIAKEPLKNKQIMLVTDGASWGQASAEMNPPKIIENMRSAGIVTSVVNLCNDVEKPPNKTKIEEMGKAGGGNVYYISGNSAADIMLAEIADDVGEKIIEIPTQVNVALRGDELLDGVKQTLSVNGFVNNTAKADATTVLTAQYSPIGTGKVDVPIYAYKDYRDSDGRVSSFTSKFAWIDHWKENGEWTKDGAGGQLLSNIFKANTPKQKTESPFDVQITYDGTNANVSLYPSRLRPDAVVGIEVSIPNVEETQKETLYFQTNGYSYDFKTPTTGKYTIKMTYTYAGAPEQEPISVFFDIAYSPEYDAFQAYDPADIHRFIRHRGQITTDGTVDLSNDGGEVATYTIDFTIPFAIAVVVLFVIDIMIRKLKWSDVKGLFKKRKPNVKKGG